MENETTKKTVEEIEKIITDLLTPYCNEEIINEVLGWALALYDKGYDDGWTENEGELLEQKYREGFEDGYQEAIRDANPYYRG